MDARSTPSDEALRRKYCQLLNGEDPDVAITSDYERWRELKRLVIVYGLPRDEGTPAQRDSPCSLRGRVWKCFLGVERDVDMTKYAALVDRGASHCDGDIRNDTFRTFRGDSEFAQRVPEEKLVRLLNVFINELGSEPGDEEQEGVARDGNLPSIRYVQGMNVLCAPLLYVLPEPDAYHTFCQLIVRHCPHYMAPQLKGVEKGCSLVDKCLQTLDPDLYRHLSTRGITARIYALPLILSLFACVPPLHELLRVWDVLFAVGVHFVVVLAVAHTVLLRDQLLQLDMDLMKVLSLRCAPPLQSDLLISVALQLLHRLPDDLLYEIARHPFANPDVPTSLPFHPETISAIETQLRKQQARQQSTPCSPSSEGSAGKEQRGSTRSRGRSTPRTSLVSRTETSLTGPARPPWKL